MTTEEIILQKAQRVCEKQIARIREAFKTARKDHLASNTVPGQPSWVEVYAIFSGNVTERMTVLADGSDIVQAVVERQRKLARKYPDYAFPFDGFVTV